ncbi:MAG TPA: CBS domain-containing protein [Candidatus Limnocylindrales bacterium]|jgi:CBS-domain-containing membrane protein
MDTTDRMSNTAELAVADLMAIEPVVVSVDATIEEAERLLSAYRIHGLPVVDGNGRLVGVISQTDLFESSHVRLGSRMRGDPSGIRVGTLMTSPAVTVPMTASLAEAARVMRDAYVHRVVAIDDEGRPVGVLAAFDYVTLAADA